MADKEIFGAFASVCIHFDGSLQSLADKLCVALNIPSLNVEPSEWPPYHEIGLAEALGWEIWLEATKAGTGTFDLRLETGHSVQEVFHDRMYDLSPWLARFLAMMCKLKVEPTTRDGD